MIGFFKNRLNSKAVQIALICFGLVHLFFLSYLAFPEESMLGIGLVGLVLFIVVHILMLATLALNALIHFREYEENLTALIISFLNVPLAFLYLNLI